ncbi:hypothetical protein [Psychromarinibacter sp. S121]|uniref:hypothetical protein n=1 Tax=Psychromarinibacter sp. S121 TaxID=3415127 RepID=UPI003C7C9FF0
MVDLRAWQIQRQDPDEPYQSERYRRVQLAVEALRSDREIDADTRNAIADLLEETKPKGRPAKPPMKWHDVGTIAEEGGKTIQEIADELGVEKRTAERGLRYFREARKAHREADK